MEARIAEKKRTTNWKALCIGMILLQSVLYGLLDPMSKRAYRQLPVYSFLMCRYLLATLALLAFRGRRIVRELRVAPVKHYIVPCLCMAAAFIFSNAGLQLTAATNVAFLRSLSALIAPLLLLIFYRKPYGIRGALRQLGVLAGLYLLCARGGLSSFGLGEICSLVSAALGAGALVFGGEALHYISPAALSCVQAGLAGGMCAGMGGITRAPGQTDRTVFAQPSIALTLVYAALGCTVAGYLLQNMALRHVSPRLVGVLQCTYPVMTALTAFVVLDERLSVSGLIGAAVILVCVALESLQKE